MVEEFKRPGWYPDPEGKPGERWFNGATWSDTRRGGAPSAPVTLTPSAPRVDPYAPSPGNTSPPLPAGARASANANAPALVGFIVGLVSVFALNFAGPVAIVFSILGIAKARQQKAAGSAGSSTLVLASIGLITGFIATVIFVVTIVAIVASVFFEYDAS